MVIGAIAGAFGVRGEIKVELLTDFPERFETLDQVALGPRHQMYTIETVRHHGAHILVKLAGIDTPEAVARLRGLELMVPRDEAVQLPEGHFFLSDAIGIRVCSADGEEIGRVTEVLRTGANDVFVVGDRGEAVLVPVIADAVRELNLPERRMVVEDWALQPYV
jgi:16S rRNA processing protein RimM